jgi:hypothetical protein
MVWSFGYNTKPPAFKHNKRRTLEQEFSNQNFKKQSRNEAPQVSAALYSILLKSRNNTVHKTEKKPERRNQKPRCNKKKTFHANIASLSNHTKRKQLQQQLSELSLVTPIYILALFFFFT